MIERTPVLNFFTHLAMLIGLVMAALPIYIVFVASSHDFRTVNLVPMPLTPAAISSRTTRPSGPNPTSARSSSIPSSSPSA